MKFIQFLITSVFLTAFTGFANTDDKMIVIASNVDIQSVDKNCWVDLFNESKFDVDHSHIRMLGPLQSATLENVAGQNWNNEIQSLIVGPNAKVYAYKNRDFSGPEIVFAQNQRVSELSELDMSDDFESLKIQCGKE